MNIKNLPLNLSKSQVGIFWDFENVSQFSIALNLLEFARQSGELVVSKAYSCNWSSEAENHLKRQGFECVHIDNPDRSKNAADAQLVKDGLSFIENSLSSDIIILVSGDCEIQKKLSLKTSKLIVFAKRGSGCQSFRKQDNKFYYTDELPELVKNVAAEEAPLTSSYISYQEAIQCLIAAIKTAIKNRIDLTTGNLSQLMHENPKFPNSKNIASVRKLDGTKFSKFSQFIDKVIREEKIPKDYQRMLLVNTRSNKINSLKN